ncbi:tetratricopeptide repeat protein [Bathymodiolus platifrons methanotrophic gill symbiont]|uniref:tetratricopeptide repeat protein n=1 Tax=Bathymodiolus platifrons methanotrophic gill symbiont TaxID=113268 RepID=UPI001C8F120C|nr:tetratricopeptide repeat protein [Bathymodiolus platifrons methanotrophic gill symbiont]
MELPCNSSRIINIGKLFRAYSLVDESNPTLSLGKVLKGDIYFAEKKYQEALQNYQLAYQIKPTIQTLDKILKSMLIQDKLQDAQKLLEQELAKNTDNTLIQLRLASLYQSSKQYDLAIKHYESVLVKQADNMTVLNNLAWVYSQQNNPKALKLAQQAYTKAPKSAAIADTYGYILLQYGQASESLTVLKHAAKLAPNIAEIQLHLAEAYIANQQKSQAKEILQHIISEQGKQATAAKKLMQAL